MSGDIREAHMRFAKELMVMYDDVNDYIFIRHNKRQYTRDDIYAFFRKILTFLRFCNKNNKFNVQKAGL